MSERDVPAGTAALAKGLTLLDLIADADGPVRFADLMRASGLPKPTFARILRTLIAFRLVRHDADHATYSLGSRVLELSHRVWENFDLAALAAPELARLSRELGETVALCRLDGDEALYVDERSGHGLGVRVDVGRRVPLHATAAGKALLAFQKPASLRQRVDRLSLDRFTDRTIIDRTSLGSDLTLIRARGYAVSIEEHLAGVNSVAAPLPDRNGVPLGAIVALAPASRLDPSRIHPIGREMMAAARRITGSAGTVAISSGPRPRGHADAGPRPECVLPWGAELGEAPVWVPGERRLYWVDMLAPAVHRYDPQTGRNETAATGKLVSAVLPGTDGRILVASQDGIEHLDFPNARLTLVANPEPDMPENRLNDGKVDGNGAIWVGSMRLDASGPGGSLYRIAPDGRVTVKETGITVSNGLGWSPDGGTLYFVETIPGLVYAYRVADDGETLSDRRVIAKIPEAEGRPDGLAVDADGGIWCAIWDGWRVDRFRPDGTRDRTIALPVPRPTSVAFGGDDLKTLFITTARTRLPASTLAEAPLSGGLFACRPGVAGLPGHSFGEGAGR